jgi:hypothetical protein
MANISSVNGVVCADIGSIDGIAKVDISLFDGIPFCQESPTPTPTPSPSPVTPTPTPTITPTPTPTPSPCVPDCCYVEICDGGDCSEACSCVNSVNVYLSMPCGCPGDLQNATGIFEDDRCRTPAKEAFYSDGTGCWFWDGFTTLTYQGPC